jgi:hypothetical protein
MMMEGGVQMEPEYQEHSHKKGGRLFIILFLAVVVLVAFGALTLFQRRTQYQALAKETEALAIFPAPCRRTSSRRSTRAQVAI